MTKEIWKDIDGYNGFYQVSTFGNVKCVKRYRYDINKKKNVIVCRNELLKPSLNHKGYLIVNIRGKTIPIHRLVAETFVPNPKRLNTVDHIDRNRQNNLVDNLRWVTPYENQKNSEQILFLTYKGETKTFLEWSKVTGINKRTLLWRFNQGWNVEDILFLKPIPPQETTNFKNKIYKGEYANG